VQIEVVEEREIKGHYLEFGVKNYIIFSWKLLCSRKKWKMGKCDGNPKILVLATWKFTLEVP
jgi:hypothetical protein